MVLFDLGTIFRGYISDASRTIAVGTLNDKQKDIYNVTLEQMGVGEYVNLIKGITVDELKELYEQSK